MKTGELGWPEKQVFAYATKTSRGGLAVGVELDGRSVIIVGPDIDALDHCASVLGMPPFDRRKIRTALVNVSREWESEVKL